MPIQPHLEVKGLKEFARKLRGIDRELARELQRTNKSVAQKVADEARPQVPVLTGRAQKSVKARASAQRSSVVGGGPNVPYYPWLEFGGRVGRGKSVSRQKVKAGRYIWPAVARHHDDHLDEYVKALNSLLDRSNLT